MTPSIEVAINIARAFCVTVVLGDQTMVERWQTLDALPSGERQRIRDNLIRGAQSRIAYGKPG